MKMKGRSRKAKNLRHVRGPFSPALFYRGPTHDDRDRRTGTEATKAKCRHTLAERIACCAFCPAAADTSVRRLRVEPDGQYVVARSVRAYARSTAVVPGCRGRCRFTGSAGRRGRSRQLGHLPAVSLSCAIWRRRSAL